MQIEYRTGDIIDAAEPILVHGCNAQGIMGSGLARAIRDRLPFAYHAYRTAYETHGLQLGQVIWAINMMPGERPRVVGNAITQEFYGNEPTQYVDDNAIRQAIHEVDRFIQIAYWNLDATGITTALDKVALPLIGAGLGGGKWPTISQIIEQESQHFIPVVYTLDGAIPHS